MSGFDVSSWEAAALLAAGAAFGYAAARWISTHSRSALARQKQHTLDSARAEAEIILRDARISAAEEAAKLRDQIEKNLAARRREIADLEQFLAKRELLINEQLEGLVQQEQQLRRNQEQLAKDQAALKSERQQTAHLLATRSAELQRIAHLSAAEAKTILLKEMEAESLRDALDLSRHILDNAKINAEHQARRILSTALQRYAGTHTFETTSATVALHGDDIKGRIIGREGRNIRAFETATGITVLIDDTPNAVVLSGFDPVRREIAREAMQRLILDGRIHPTRIEEVVAQVSQEIQETIVKAGEEALSKVGLPPLHGEIIKLLGSLRFRQSFSQNILDHSIEVAHLTALMAAELGVDVTAAKRAGLLHDIGKAINHEVEGSHAIVGAQFIQRYGESEDIVNAVASHHDEVPHTNLLGILVSAADAISASRPGARSETMTTYVKRLETLEKIGLGFPGVDKCFAVQAGRELRVMVRPDQLNDDQAATLARAIVRKIEDDLQYPGQIRVTVVRETRCIEYAK